MAFVFIVVAIALVTVCAFAVAFGLGAPWGASLIIGAMVGCFVAHATWSAWKKLE
jgi:hypothetical protein